MTAATLATLLPRPATPPWTARGLPLAFLAMAVAAAITVGRAIGEWPLLSIGRLPDNDDMMRLAQVRDWLGGQRFNDLTQYRLGLEGGAPMHWSRIADAGPALLILMLRPFLGEQAAITTMLVLHQGLLFFAYLLLSARLGGRLAGDRARAPALLLAALAFPTITLFQPGRIDHHALQIVLTMIVADAIVAAPTVRAGVAGGIAAALSLAVGLEVAPELVAAISVVGLRWIAGGAAEDRRLGGFAGALGLLTLLMLGLARPDDWPAQWCDGFTPSSTRATLAGALGLGALALAGSRLPEWRGRLGAAGLIGGATGAYVLLASPVCLAGPYAAMHPFVKAAFMDNVSEAQGLFVGPDTIGTVIGYGGLTLASLGALALLLRDSASRTRWWPFALFLTGGVVAAVLQVRVTYIVAGLAAQPFAALLARAHAPAMLGRRLLLWLTGAGVAYGALGVAVDARTVSPGLKSAQRAAKECSSGAPLLALARMPAGAVMAPMDSGAYIVGMTPHRSFAAGYHRNNAGNLAMYRFFLTPPDGARAMAAKLGVDYVVACVNSHREDNVFALRRGTLIEALHDGGQPAWLRRVAHEEGGMTVYRVVDAPRGT